MPVARPESSDSRIIAHVDMDCFYVQVEQRKQPILRGQPTAVVQYNSWKGGGLIAVSYEARKYGVKRSMRGDEAKQVCPEIQLVQVPVARGKADLSIYRNAGSEVVSILSRKGRCERASIDEVYLDLTDAAETMLAETPPESSEGISEEVLKSHVLGLNVDGSDVKENVKEWFLRSDADHRDKLLACGALIVAELRLQVLEETGFSCSAGIAHNKMLAKLASGMNKPAQQTVVPFSSVKGLLEPLPIKKMKQLGGKLGSSLQIDLGVNTVGDLLKFSEEKLQEHYGINTGTWLWNIARGISGEEVEGRLLPKSHGSGKTFPGPRALKTIASVEHWLNELCEELSERLQSDLDQNKRIAHTLTLNARAYQSNDSDSHKKFPSKSCPLSGWRMTGLSVTASKIFAIPSGTCSIMKYFHGQDQFHSSAKQPNEKIMQDVAPLSPSGSECDIFSCRTEPWTKCGEEVTVMPSLDEQEDERKMCKNKDMCVAMRYTHDQDPSCSSSKQAEDDLAEETSLLSPSGADDSLILKQAEPLSELHGEENRMKYTLDGMRRHDQKGKTSHEKGASSILKFFQSRNKQEHVNTVQETKASSSLGSQSKGNGCSNTVHVEIGTLRGANNSSQNGGRMDTWSYKVDEIDPAVINELPPEIQEEVREWLRPHKRANTVKRGSSIAHYFLPNKTG